MRLLRPQSALIATTAIAVAVASAAASSAAPTAPTTTATTPAKPTPTPKPTPVPTPTPEPIPTTPVCTTGAASHGAHVEKLRGRVLTTNGVVEIRGTGTLFSVEACAGRNAYPTQEFVLLKAPKTKRFVAVRTVLPHLEPDGTIAYAYADYALPRTEKAFDRTIPRPKRTLQLPGIKGSVFVDRATPLELLASRRNGQKITQNTKQLQAKAYLLTGGVLRASKPAKQR